MSGRNSLCSERRSCAPSTGLTLRVGRKVTTFDTKGFRIEAIVTFRQHQTLSPGPFCIHRTIWVVSRSAVDISSLAPLSVVSGVRRGHDPRNASASDLGGIVESAGLCGRRMRAGDAGGADVDRADEPTTLAKRLLRRGGR